jgi:hypothetical protein
MASWQQVTGRNRLAVRFTLDIDAARAELMHARKNWGCFVDSSARANPLILLKFRGNQHLCSNPAEREHLSQDHAAPRELESNSSMKKPGLRLAGLKSLGKVGSN